MQNRTKPDNDCTINEHFRIYETCKLLSFNNTTPWHASGKMMSNLIYTADALKKS